MAIYQCPTCGEQYPDVHANGDPYFHACSPVSTTMVLALAPAERAALHPALATATTPEQIRLILRPHTIYPPGARNENIQPGFRHAPRMAGDLSPFPDPPRIAYDPPPIVISR